MKIEATPKRGVMVAGLNLLAGLAMPACSKKEQPSTATPKLSGAITKEGFDRILRLKIPGLQASQYHFDPKNERTVLLVGEVHSDKPTSERAVLALQGLVNLDFLACEGFIGRFDDPRNFESWKRVFELRPDVSDEKRAEYIAGLNVRDITKLGSAELSSKALGEKSGLTPIGIESNEYLDKTAYFASIGGYLTPLQSKANSSRTPRDFHEFLKVNKKTLNDFHAETQKLNAIDPSFPVVDISKFVACIDNPSVASINLARDSINEFAALFMKWSVAHGYPERNIAAVEEFNKLADGKHVGVMIFGNSHFSIEAGKHGKTITQLLVASGFNVIHFQPDKAIPREANLRLLK